MRVKSINELSNYIYKSFPWWINNIIKTFRKKDFKFSNNLIVSWFFFELKEIITNWCKDNYQQPLNAFKFRFKMNITLPLYTQCTVTYPFVLFTTMTSKLQLWRILCERQRMKDTNNALHTGCICISSLKIDFWKVIELDLM